jgi:hypothetical protein
MRDDQYRFLSIHRLNAEQVGWILNVQPHDIPTLVVTRLLKPLGNPAANGCKYFSAADVLELAKDRSWLARVSAAITQYWQKRNAMRKHRTAPMPSEASLSEG